MAKSRANRRRTLSVRFLQYFAAAYLALIGLMGVGIMLSVHSTLVDRLIAQLETDARLAQRSLPADTAAYSEWASSVFEISGARVTLIDESGVVLADSHSDPNVMENHSQRPEVVAATGGETGVAARRSATTGYDQQYVALPPVDGLIVRLSISELEVQDQVAAIRNTVILMAVAVGLIGIGIVAILSRRMARPISQLTNETIRIAGGDSAVRPSPSSVYELDQLSLAVGILANDLGTQLAESKSAAATLEAVMGALPQGTVLVTGESGIEYANPAAELLIGRIPTTVNGLVPLALQTLVGDCRHSGASVITELDYGTPSRRLAIEAAPLGERGAVLLILTDVTEAERQASVRRDFVANASHELKTPLASIVAASEALRIALDRDPEMATKFADQIEISAHQLSQLVSDLLDLSRLDREIPDMAAVSLDALVSKTIEPYRVNARAAGIELTVGTIPVEILGSERDLVVAVRNVVDNALRHTEAGDAIEVMVEREGEFAVVSVSDTGEGIPARDLDRIFERFYRVDAARSRSSGGTGLGLAIVKHAVESHGGRVEVASTLDEGSVFRLLLPLP